MKIFNWVHRRFHHKYDQAAGEDVTKTEFTRHGKDHKLSLLENAAAAMDIDDVGAFGGDYWKEAGILAIGTFGFDPALWKDFEDQGDTYLCDDQFGREEEYLCNDYGSGNHQQDEEEVEFPLVLKACKHGFFHDHHAHESHQCDHQDENTHDEVQVKERITLADLFWGQDSSSDHQNKLLMLKKSNKLTDDEDQLVKVHYSTESINAKHNAKSYDDEGDHDRVALISMKTKKKKKLMTTRDHAAARPINKLNRMVRKMLKKKIHPDVENRKDTAVRLKPMRIPGSLD